MAPQNSSNNFDINISIHTRFSPNVSAVILLGLVIITTVVWYVSVKAEAAGQNFKTHFGQEEQLQ